MEEELPMDAPDWWDPRSKRFWSLLFMLGLMLHVVVTSVSELGLDAHIHSTYVTVEQGTGEGRLDWGHTRPVDPHASDPDNSPDIKGRYWAWHAWLDLWYDFMGPEAVSAQTGSLMLAALVLFAVWRTTERLYGTEEAARLTALVSINPALLFAAGRVYPEEFMLLAISVALLTLILGLRTGGKGMPILWLMAPAAVLFGATVKGLDPTTAVLLFILGFVIFAIDDSNELLIKVTRRPRRSFTAASIMVFLFYIIIAFIADSDSSVAAMRRAPLRFLSALFFAFIDVFLIFILLGMVLWPFIGGMVRSSAVVVDREAGLLAAVIGAMTTGICLHIASLWTHESLLWGADWPWLILALGNNARYATMLMIPCFWYIMRVNQLDIDEPVASLDSLEERWKAVLIGVCLILPLALLASFHGQTSWTGDAAEELSSRMDDGEDFLFVSETTLGMHWLYSFHLDIDPKGERNITGHWRSMETDWLVELSEDGERPNRGNLSQVEWLVLAPEVVFDNPQGYTLIEKADAPFMNGGGEWTLWSRDSR